MIFNRQRSELSQARHRIAELERDRKLLVTTAAMQIETARLVLYAIEQGDIETARTILAGIARSTVTPAPSSAKH